MNRVVLVLLGLASACGETVIHGRDAASSASACDRYLACLEELVDRYPQAATSYQATLEQARVQYGAGGACASSALARHQCDTACAQATSSAARAFPSVTSCAGPTAGGPGGPIEPVDMARGGGPDFTPAQKTGCAGYVTCYTSCFSTQSNPSASLCRSLCAAEAELDAPDRFDQAMACGQQHCLAAASDGTPARCLLSGSQLVNADGAPIAQTDPGTGQKACGRCLNDALARLFGDACVDVSSTDCNPVACRSVTDACIFDGP